MNQKLIKIEGFMVLLVGIYLYFSTENHWALFLLLLLVPDISMIGYAINERIGARVYNAAHTYTVPLLLLIAGQLSSIESLTLISFIWLAHIGMDRMMGYGLKYESNFKETHLQRL